MSLNAAACSLRPLEAGDRERILEWRNKPRVRRSAGDDGVISAQKHERWFAAAVLSRAALHRVFLYEGRPLGIFSAKADSDHGHGWEAGWYLGEDDTPPGAGTALVLLGLAELWRAQPALDRVAAVILDDNLPSRRLAERLGFEDAGPEPGARAPAHRYLLTPERFREHVPACERRLFGRDLPNT